jgi:excisionase family DNA binding protein
MSVLDGFRSVPPTADDMSMAIESSRQLSQCLDPDRPADFSQISVLSGDQVGEPVRVPQAALRLFVEVLNQMAQGNIVTLVPIHAELTTQEAADLINVSRPFLVKQLETDQIPFRKVGKHRRIKFHDLMAYKQQIDRSRHDALDELVALDQALGLGYD